MKEALYGVFSEGPINWLKWGLVFATLIISYRIAIPIYRKIDYKWDIQRKVEKAIEKGHVFKGTLKNIHVSYGSESEKHSKTDCHATYEYEINGKTKKFNALIIDRSTAPDIMNLYYIDNPRKVFSVEDYHWSPFKGLVTAAIIFSPWIAAALVGIIIRIPVNQ